MPARRRTDPAEGLAAVRAVEDVLAEGGKPARSVLATAVRYTLEELAARYPGGSVEVRVPPFAAVQVIEGPRHTRGTPPAVVEMDAGTWIGLATGALGFGAARAAGRVQASGNRADLGDLLPVVATAYRAPVSEQSQTPTPDAAPEHGDAEGTAFVQVTRRKAPRFRAFALTGLLLALLVAAVVAATTSPSGGYSQRALFGYLFCSLGLVGVLLGALVAVLVDRRTGTRPQPRTRPGRRR